MGVELDIWICVWRSKKQNLGVGVSKKIRIQGSGRNETLSMHCLRILNPSALSEYIYIEEVALHSMSKNRKV